MIHSPWRKSKSRAPAGKVSRTRSGTVNSDICGGQDTANAFLTEHEPELDYHARGDGPAEAQARTEAPLPHGDHRLFVEPAIERMRDANARGIDAAVGEHDDVHDDDALDLGAHGVDGVVRPYFADEHRRA